MSISQGGSQEHFPNGESLVFQWALTSLFDGHLERNRKGKKMLEVRGRDWADRMC